MEVKAVLFVGIAVLAGVMVWLEAPRWSVAVGLVLVGWGSARAYYFGFYVVEHWVDRRFRFAGLWGFAVWGWRGGGIGWWRRCDGRAGRCLTPAGGWLTFLAAFGR